MHLISKYKNSRRAGFTLIELAAAAAILALVLLTVSVMMGSGANLTRSLTSEAELQTRLQTGLAQVREYLLDANGAAIQDGNDLYFTVYERSSDAEDPEHPGQTLAAGKLFRLTYDESGEQLLLTIGTVSAGTGSPSCTWQEPALLCSGVTGFTAELHTGADTGTAESVSISLTVAEGSRSCSADELIALRNRPALPDSDGPITETLLAAVWPGSAHQEDAA